MNEFNKDQFLVRGEVLSNEFRKDEQGEWFLPLHAEANNTLLVECLGTDLSLVAAGEFEFSLLGVGSSRPTIKKTTQTFSVIIHSDIIRGDENNGEQIPLYPTQSHLVDAVRYEVGPYKEACAGYESSCRNLEELTQLALSETQKFAESCSSSADGAEAFYRLSLAEKEAAKQFSALAGSSSATATVQAGIASTKAEIASTQTGIATTKAQEATAKALAAATSASLASEKAILAQAAASSVEGVVTEAEAARDVAVAAKGAVAQLVTNASQSASTASQDAQLAQKSAESAAISEANAATSEGNAQERAMESGEFAFTSKQYANDVLASKNAAKESEYNAASSAEYATSAAARAQNAADGAEDVLAHSAKTDESNTFEKLNIFIQGAQSSVAAISDDDIPNFEQVNVLNVGIVPKITGFYRNTPEGCLNLGGTLLREYTTPEADRTKITYTDIESEAFTNSEYEQYTRLNSMYQPMRFNSVFCPKIVMTNCIINVAPTSVYDYECNNMNNLDYYFDMIRKPQRNDSSGVKWLCRTFKKVDNVPVTGENEILISNKVSWLGLMYATAYDFGLRLKDPQAGMWLIGIDRKYSKTVSIKLIDVIPINGYSTVGNYNRLRIYNNANVINDLSYGYSLKAVFPPTEFFTAHIDGDGTPAWIHRWVKSIQIN